MLLQRRSIFLLVVALFVSASASRLPAQSNTSVLAIVGARIVDGSGNEPFDGTVVVRDGRIAEVGRSVRPPEGATTIDAHGRIVTPGWIDARVHLPSGGTDDALARAMAAYLYAGVTTIGVADLDENKLDALREHLATAKIRAPRLVAASAPSNAMLASSLGGAVPDALALADWKKRNATFVPEVLGNGTSDGKVALDRLRAAEAAGVRIGVGSNAGGPDLPPGTSTLREMQRLMEGGLTSLQALTAVTSGSAWALGLQSDRAFLAVGQRADLTILIREPGAAASGDATLVDRVFVGGEEIDRAALNAIITRPEPAPAAPTSAAPAEASSNVATPVTPAATPGKAVGRAPKKGRGRTRDTTPAPAGAGTAAPASEAPAVSATPESTTPAATAPATATPATTTPATATPAATAAPATTTGAPATSEAASRAPAATGGAAARGAGGAAGGAGAAMAPVLVTDPLIDDFEAGGDRTGLGPAWNASNDSGSASDVIVGRVVRGLRDHALHVTARMGDAGDPYARITVTVAHDGHPADVSQFHGLRFDARGQGRYRVVFVTRSVTDGRYHESYFSGSPLWTPVSIPFGTLGQTGAGAQQKWTGGDLLEIAFQIERDPGQMGWLELDNVRFY